MDALIDGDIIIYTVIFRKKAEQELGEVSADEAIYRTRDFLGNTLARLNTNRYIGFLQGADNFRYRLLDTYKSGRAEKPPLHKIVFNHLREEYGFHVVNGMETDDAIAICHHDNSVVVSTDHDFLQLPGWNYNPRSSVLTHITEEEAELNFWKQMLTGCTTDKVPGLPGIGNVKALKILTNPEKHNHYYYRVLEQYINYYGRKNNIGLKMFLMNYELLYLRREDDKFIKPECRVFSLF